MLISFALIILSGLLFAYICKLIRLPSIVGMLVAGILLGPYALNLLSPCVTAVSYDLRQIALIIILLKAGLSLNLSDLKKVGRPAVLMSFLPAVCEIISFAVFAPLLFKISVLEACIIGSIVSAVSPAVVVPKMVNLIEKNIGNKNAVPQLILAGASLDDIFVIVMFTAFINMEQGTAFSFISIINIPVSIILGLFIGWISGCVLFKAFGKLNNLTGANNSTVLLLIFISISFIFVYAQDAVKNYIAFAGLLAVMGMACSFKLYASPNVCKTLLNKLSCIWTGAEILLFVLVGACVDIRYMFNAGFAAIILIIISLVFRSAGVLLALIKTDLSRKERMFCVLAYLPKATVQAAIGSIPLSLGLGCGETALSVAVIAILFTAPLGALAIDASNKKLLDNN